MVVDIKLHATRYLQEGSNCDSFMQGTLVCGSCAGLYPGPGDHVKHLPQLVLSSLPCEVIGLVDQSIGELGGDGVESVHVEYQCLELRVHVT